MGKMLLSYKINSNNKLSIIHKKKSSTNFTRPISVKSKYGDKSIYFDLDDMENTTGSWEMYGYDEKNRYPAMQEQFFAKAGQALNRRESMYAFVAVLGTASLLIWGVKGSQDAKLPITIGPKQAPKVGPRGRV